MVFERGRLRRRYALIAVIFLVSLLIFHYSRLLKPVENILVRLVQPLQIRLYKVGQTVQTIEKGEDLKTLTRDELATIVQQLRDENQSLAVDNAHLKTVFDESQLLEKQVAFLTERSFQAVTARVTSRSSEQFTQSLLINRGAADGVHTGFPVIVEDGILIGTLRTVSDHSSEVLLTTSFDSRLSARVQNEARSQGIVRGEHNLSLRMEFIPQLDALAIHDAVVTNGEDPFIPQGLLIGRVQEVFNASGTLFQEASLTTLVGSSDIFIVSILIP